MKKIVKYWWTLIVFLILVLCISRLFWSNPKNTVEKNKTEIVKVGVILPLSGPVAAFGKWAQNGMNIALEEEKNDSINRNLELIFEDSKFDAKTGLMAYHKLITVDNVNVIISAMSKVSIPILEEKGRNIPVFLQDVTYPKITEKYKNVLRHFIQSDREATVLSKFATDSLKLKTVGILYVNDEAGNGAKKAFEKLFSKKGKVVIAQSFENRAKDVRTQVTKIIEKKPECVFLFGNGPTWALALKTLRQLNYKGKILTNTAMYIPVFRKIAGEATEGVYFTYPYMNTSDKSTKKFIELYQNKYDEFPPLEAAYGYDLIKIISKTKYNNNNITLPKSFNGAFGHINIPNNKDIITKVALAIFQNNKIKNLLVEN